MRERNDARPGTAADRRRALGVAIRAARGALTQADLGKAVGRPQSCISVWERGGTDLTVETLHRVEVALRLPAGHLMIRAGLVATQPH